MTDLKTNRNIVSEIFTAEKLLKCRKRKGQTEYLVKWRGFDHSHNTWEPNENILDPLLIHEFNDKRKKKSAARRRIVETQRRKARNSCATESSVSSDEPVSPPQQLQSNASTQFTSKPTLSVPSLASNASVRSEDVELASLIREVQGLRHLPKERYSLGALRVASEYRRRFGKKDSPPSTPRPVDIISAKLNVSTKEQEPVSPGQARNGDEHIHPKKRWMFQGSHVDEMTKETVTEVTCENVTVKILEKIS